MASVRIGINGFGRIGRGIARAINRERAWVNGRDIEIVAINDLTDAATLAHLLKYDSVHGHYGGEVGVTDDSLVVDGRVIPVTAERDPAAIKWGDADVDIVLECTGIFRKRAAASKHIEGGAKAVVISAPAPDPDVTLAVGINLDKYDPAKHKIVSNASCTTNCLAPVAKVLHEEFEIVEGLMTTIHSYTADQRILDAPHKDLRRARAAGMSMIPTTTGAAAALKEVLPELEGRLDGFAIRVPTPNVSLVDLTVRLGKKTTRDAINDAMKSAAAGALDGVLSYSDLPLVSSDYNGNPYSSIVDGPSTRVLGEMAKIVTWYDNEFGYSNRLVDLALHMGKSLS